MLNKKAFNSCSFSGSDSSYRPESYCLLKDCFFRKNLLFIVEIVDRLC